MPSVTLLRPRGKKIWYAKWRMPNGKYRKKSLNTEDRRLALDIKVKIEEEILRSNYGIGGDSDLTPDHAWKEYTRVANKSEMRLAVEKKAWLDFWRVCGKQTLKTAKRSDVSFWVKDMTTHFKPSTINTATSMVSSVFNHLIREEIYDGPNPLAGRRKVREEKKIRVIAWPVIEKMLEDTKGEPIYFAIVLGGLLGLRKGEIVRARWEDIDWDAETVAVRGTKTEASSDNLHLHPILRRYLEPYRKADGWIVDPPTAGQGTFLYRWNTQHMWKKVAKAHGIPDARLHDLRHSFATRLLDLGYPLKDISKMLRHTSLATTQIYADLRTVKVQLGDISSVGVV